MIRMSLRILLLVIACAAAPACGNPPPTSGAAHDAAEAARHLPPPAAAPVDPRPAIAALLEQADSIDSLKAVAIAHQGGLLAERGYGNAGPDSPTNIKSASKTVVSALVGIAIDKGLLEGVDQPIAPLLRDQLPADPDPRLSQVTIGHLLSMQAGLERTSGSYYGRWVASADWVRDALARPFVDEPGGAMLYSTGSTHLLSAILVGASGRSTLALAREWLGPQQGFAITAWDQDPQGIHFGGNNMAMSTRSLLAFGELYRNGGVSDDGGQLVPPGWIEASWQPRTHSRFTGDGYGYGWFLRDIAGEPVYYAWGYGGQMLYVVPSLQLTVAMTSDDSEASARSGHRNALHGLMGDIITALRSARGSGTTGTLHAAPPGRSEMPRAGATARIASSSRLRVIQPAVVSVPVSHVHRVYP